MEESPTFETEDASSTRIPTYFIKKTTTGVSIFGSGYLGEVFPNFVFLRGKEYRFLFYNKESLVDLYDKDGNLLKSPDIETWNQPFVMRLGNNYPNEIRYRMRESTDSKFGVISLRDENKINGRVIAYGYARGVGVTDGNLYNVETDQDGVFSLYLQNTGKRTHSVSHDLYSSGGFDSMLIDDHDSETYQTMFKFNFKTTFGSLMLNSFTTLFWYISKRYLATDYKKINSRICEYFGLSHDYEILTTDPIQSYLTGKLPLINYSKLLLFTCWVEFVANQNNENLQEQFYERITSEILKGDGIFDFIHLDFSELHQYADYYLFRDVYYVIATRLVNFKDKNIKKTCSLEEVLSLIFKFRRVAIKKNISYDVFLRSNLSIASGKIRIPPTHDTLLLTFVEGSPVAPFGKYAKIKLTTSLLETVFNQTLPVEPEVINKVIGKTFYIKHDAKNFFCYRVADFIDYEYALPEISTSDIMSGFNESSACCELEKFLRQSEQEKGPIADLVAPEVPVATFKMFNGQKDQILEIGVTNKNKPFEQISFVDRFYINQYIPLSYRYTPPTSIAVSRDYSTKIEKINISFDGGILNTTASKIRYDYDTIKIKNTEVVDDVLNLTTSHPHGYNPGDVIIIKNSSRNGLINGRHDVLGSTETTLTVAFQLPAGVLPSEIDGSYGELESLQFSKIYCDVKDFQAGDTLIFEHFVSSRRFEVVSIKRDYLGDYLSVSGIVPRSAKIFTKQSSQADPTEILEYKYEPNPEYYDLDFNTDEYDLFISAPSTAVNSRFDAFISQIDISLKLKSTPDILFTKRDTQTNTTASPDSPATDDTPLSTPGSIPTPSTDSPVADIPEPPVVADVPKTPKSLDVIHDSITGEPDVPELSPFTRPMGSPTSDYPFPDEPEPEQELVSTEDVESYHFNRKYLREEFELQLQGRNYDEIYDWNGDGHVGQDELEILERVILTSPKTVEEYNENRGDYPFAKLLPTIANASYACQEYCCHDDYTESYNFNLEDVSIYDAFQSYLDEIPEEVFPDHANFSYHYMTLVYQGIAPQLSNEIVYMPTDPRQSTLCADFTGTGEIIQDDTHIYYAYQLYMQSHTSPPTDLGQFKDYYDQLVSSGIVPALLNEIEILPSLQTEQKIMSADGEIRKDCENVSWKDLSIYSEWLRQGKPTDLDEFNASRSRSRNVPIACFLPQDGDPAPQDPQYDDFGGIDFTFAEVNAGLTNL